MRSTTIKSIKDLGTFLRTNSRAETVQNGRSLANKIAKHVVSGSNLLALPHKTRFGKGVATVHRDDQSERSHSHSGGLES